MRPPGDGAGMSRRLPPIAIALGLLGLLPFLAGGFGAVGFREPMRAARALEALIAYGAVILSFLGAVHWGIALEDDTGLARVSRYGLGVVPALVGWVALLGAAETMADVALAVLALGFGATIAVEQRGATRGLVPLGYLGLRWVLSVVVVVVLVAVLVMRLVGWRL